MLWRPGVGKTTCPRASIGSRAVVPCRGAEPRTSPSALNTTLQPGELAEGALGVTFAINVIGFNCRAGVSDVVSVMLGTAAAGGPGFTATATDERDALGANRVLVEGSSTPAKLAFTLCKPAAKVKSSAALP